MFKKFKERIAKAMTRDEALINVYYGKKGGIRSAYVDGLLTWTEHKALLEQILALA